MTAGTVSTADPAPLVSARDVGVRWSERWIIRHVDVAVPRGALVYVIGANGAGKSTCAKAVLGLIGIDEGRSSARPAWRWATSPSASPSARRCRSRCAA